MWPLQAETIMTHHWTWSCIFNLVLACPQSFRSSLEVKCYLSQSLPIHSVCLMSWMCVYDTGNRNVMSWWIRVVTWAILQTLGISSVPLGLTLTRASYTRVVFISCTELGIIVWAVSVSVLDSHSTCNDSTRLALTLKSYNIHFTCKVVTWPWIMQIA